MDSHKWSEPSSPGALPARLPRVQLLVASCLVLATLFLTLLHAPTRAPLTLDNGIYIYMGQRILAGVPPYVSALERKTPLTYLLDALALSGGRLLGLDDVIASRVFFAPLGALAVLATLLSAAALCSVRQWRHGPAMPAVGALAAGAAMLASYVVPYRAAVGPEPKLVVIAAGGFGLWLASRRSWRWAGCCAALAFLTWQPAGVYGLAVLAAAAAQPRHARVRTVGRVVLGAAIPIAAVAGYFWLAGGLATAIRQTTDAMFNSLGKAVGDTGLAGRLRDNAWGVWLVARGALRDQKILFPLGALGVALCLAEPIGSARTRSPETQKDGQEIGVSRSVAWLPAMIVSLGFAALSLLDFQGQPDLIVLLQVMAWGVGWLILVALDRIVPIKRPAWAAAGGLAVVLAIGAWVLVDNRAHPNPAFSLNEQKRLTQELYARVGAGAEIQALSCLSPLVIAGHANATPVWHIGPVWEQIIDTEVGGIEAVANDLNERRVPVVILVTQFEGNRKLAAMLGKSYGEQTLDLPLCGSWYPMQILVRKQ